MADTKNQWTKENNTEKIKNKFRTVKKIFQISLLAASAVNLIMAFLSFPQKGLVVVGLLFVEVAISVGLTVFTNKNRNAIGGDYLTDRRNDSICTVIWLVSLFLAYNSFS